MQEQIKKLAILSFIDQRLDELSEEFGDLPEQVKQAESIVSSAREVKEETERILQSIREFCSTSKQTLIQLKDKEEKLSKQQFNVRNNKEFDAITKEIAFLKKEHEDLSDKLRTEGLKEENLLRILESQKKDLLEAEKELDVIKSEFQNVSGDQDEEVSKLKQKRKETVKELGPNIIKDYERIRSFYTDAAVKVRKNSCSGCFSSIPPQVIVEIRNNQNKVFNCESCGRILLPEETNVDESVIDI